MSMTHARISEEISLNLWQPLQTILYDGWVLRFANGYTKRANSVSPIYFSSENIHEKITYCEDQYAAHGLKTIFKITPFIQPENLDHILKAKGYAVVDQVSVQRADITQVKQPSISTVQIDQQPNDEWIHHFCRLSSVDDKHKQTMKRMLSNHCSTKGFFTLYHNDEVAACGLGMIDRKVLGIYDIVTHPNYRNQGYGEQLMLHIIQWGKNKGAEHSDLAVLLHNEPALKLYAKLGFQEMYRYWFRVK